LVPSPENRHIKCAASPPGRRHALFIGKSGKNSPLGESSPKIFKDPTPVEDALAFVDALLAARGVHLATLGPEWPRLRQLCIEKQLKGNAVPDAWLAAATIHLGEHLVSFDRAFRKLIGRSQFKLLEADAG